VIQNTEGSQRQPHHDTGVEETPGNWRQSLDEGDNPGDSQGDPPGRDESFSGRIPQSHAVEGRQQVIEGIVSVGSPDDQREGSLDDERGKLEVEALVALGVGEKEAAQGVQTEFEIKRIVVARMAEQRLRRFPIGME